MITHSNIKAATVSQDQMLQQADVCRLLGISAPTFWRWRNDTDFPRAVVIRRRNFFRLSEVNDWLNRQPRAGKRTTADLLGG